MRFLILRHIDAEHPGILRDFMAEDGVRRDTVELDEGDAIPPLDGYDAMVVMGGPMDVWEEDAHPWLAPEKAAIAEPCERRAWRKPHSAHASRGLGMDAGGRVGVSCAPSRP